MAFKKITKKSRITLIELPATQFGRLNGNIEYDIYSASKLPARAIHVLEAVLKKDKWEDIASINPLYHGKHKKLSKENFKRILSSDVLGISCITRTSFQSMQLARFFKLKNPGGIVIAGGPDPTFRAEEWLKHVDIVVRGEGEKTISELMKGLKENPEELDNINGIAYKKNGKIIITKPRALLAPDELSSLPHPFYDKKTRKKVSVAVVETSRGCPNNCDFCSVTEFYGRMHRRKTIEYVIEELKQTKDMGGMTFFIDDNFVANPEHSINLLKEIARQKLNKKLGIAQVTVKVAENPELMKALKNAGILGLCIGIESINDNTLKSLGKPYSAEQNIKAIKKLKQYGFWIHGMMMPGGDGDNFDSLKKTLKWANKYLDSVQFFPVGPLPGTRLRSRLKNEAKILREKIWFLYDGHNVLIKPKNFTPYQLQTFLNKMYKNFYSWKNGIRRLIRSPYPKFSIFLLFYTKFGGMRRLLYSPQSINHLKFLKRIN